VGDKRGVGAMMTTPDWLSLLCALWLAASLLAGLGFGRWLRWRMKDTGAGVS